MDFSVFLTHFDSAGAKTHIPLDRYDTFSTYYLPNDSSNPQLNISRDRDNEHFSVRLDIGNTYCLLSVYSNEPEPTFVLGDCNVEIPVSTSFHQKSFIITEHHQIVSAAGRWQIEWDRSGNITQSMGPPPIPAISIEVSDGYDNILELIPSKIGEGLVERKENTHQNDEGDYPSIPVAEIQLSPPSAESSDDNSLSSAAHQHSLPSDQTIRARMNNTLSSNMVNIVEREIADVISSELPSLAGKHFHKSDNKNNSIEFISAPIDVSACNTVVPSAGPEVSDQGLTLSTGINLGTLVPTTAEAILPITTEMGSAEAFPPKNQPAINTNMLPAQPQSSSRPGHQPSTNPSTNAESDEETASEDESQLQKDMRMPKRRIFEIEDGQEVGSKKRQRIATSSTNEIPNEQRQSNLQDTPTTTKTNLPKFTNEDVPKDEVQDVQGEKLSKKKTQVDPNLSAEKAQNICRKVASGPARRSSRHKSETPNSIRSTQSHDADYGKPKIIFGSGSMIPKDPKFVSVIQRLGGTIVQDINNADVLCVGNDSLKKTSKLIIAIVKGKDIVTDEWIKQAHADQKFPDRHTFMPKDKQHEVEWKFCLKEAVERGRHGLNLLDGVHVYLTKQLRQDLGNLTKELKNVAVALGAVKVHRGLPKDDVKNKVLIVGSTKNVDPDGARVNRLGHKLYGQDILTMAAIRGQLDMESDEHAIELPVKDEPSSQ